MRKMLALVAVLGMALLAACGGGGDGADGMPTSAVLIFSAQGTLPAGVAVSGVGATIELPTGVTVQTDAGGAVDPAVVVPSGLLAGANGTLGPVIYTPATATTKARLDFTVVSMAVAGAGVGEYATITLILAGVDPAVTAFNVTAFEPIDLSYAAISTLTAKLDLTVY